MMAPHYAKAAKLMKNVAKFGTIDCQQYSQFCAGQSIQVGLIILFCCWQFSRLASQGYPTVFFYPRNKKKSKVKFNDQPFTDQIANFVRSQLKNVVCRFRCTLLNQSQEMIDQVVDFSPNQYENEIISKQEPWLLVFGAPWCGLLLGLRGVFMEWST